MKSHKSVPIATICSVNVQEIHLHLKKCIENAKKLDQFRGDSALLLQQCTEILKQFYPTIEKLSDGLLAPNNQNEKLADYRACFLLGNDTVRYLKKAAEFLNEHAQNDDIILFQGQLLIANDGLNHFERILLGAEESTRFELDINHCLLLAKTLRTPNLLDSRFPDLLFDVSFIINQLTNHLKKINEKLIKTSPASSEYKQIIQQFQQCEECWKMIFNLEAMKEEKPLRKVLNDSLHTLESQRVNFNNLLFSRKENTNR